jgi:hypothetical protein
MAPRDAATEFVELSQADHEWAPPDIVEFDLLRVWMNAMCVVRTAHVAQRREQQMNTPKTKTEIAATALATDAQDSAPASQSGRIEAYGVKGMKSRPWRRTFKDVDALTAWCEKNEAEVYGTRQVEGR